MKLWDRYGIVVDIGKHRRFYVKTNSGRALVRNRRFLRRRVPTSVPEMSAPPLQRMLCLHRNIHPDHPNLAEEPDPGNQLSGLWNTCKRPTSKHNSLRRPRWMPGRGRCRELNNIVIVRMSFHSNVSIRVYVIT